MILAGHAADNRLFVHGVLWILRSGARWSDLPPRYGKYKTVHRRFGRWADKGVWEKVFAALIADPSNDYVMLDASLVKAHQQAATGKKGRQKPGAGAFPRRTDHQDPPALRRAGSALTFAFDARLGGRDQERARVARRHPRQGGCRRPRLRRQSGSINRRAFAGISDADAFFGS